MTTFTKEIVFDPPLTDVPKENHDYVRIEISSTEDVSLLWFLEELKRTSLWDRFIVEFPFLEEKEKQ